MKAPTLSTTLPWDRTTAGTVQTFGFVRFGGAFTPVVAVVVFPPVSVGPPALPPPGATPLVFATAASALNAGFAVPSLRSNPRERSQVEGEVPSAASYQNSTSTQGRYRRA